MKKYPVIYQMFLRSCTKEGTLSAAEKKLALIKSLGVDVVYLCPVVKADGDERPEYWSTRQKECGFNNPKNPYRQSDYFKIDEEYGTEDDLHSFINTAHSLGLKVLLDLVYLHCGPCAEFIGDNEEYILHDEDGNRKYTEYNFLLLNFESDKLREYLWSNMEYFIREFDADGYRCDVGDAVPLDFWQEGRKRIEAIKPDIYMLNESTSTRSVLSGVFDSVYFPFWSDHTREVFLGEKPASYLIESEKNNELPDNLRLLRAIDTHDTVNDCYDKRFEKMAGEKRAEAAVILQYTLGGIPFIYNGNEICDTNRHSICSNRFYGGKCVDWSRQDSPEAQRRMEIIKKISDIRNANPSLYEGSMEWIPSSAPDSIISFKRSYNGEVTVVIINTKAEAIRTEVKISGTYNELLSRNVQYNHNDSTLCAELGEGGYLLLQSK